MDSNCFRIGESLLSSVPIMISQSTVFQFCGLTSAKPRKAYLAQGHQGSVSGEVRTIDPRL